MSRHVFASLLLVTQLALQAESALRKQKWISNIQLHQAAKDWVDHQYSTKLALAQADKLAADAA
jgi:hypothetical protein